MQQSTDDPAANNVMYEINAWDDDDFAIMLNGSTVEGYESADAEGALDFIIEHSDATFAFGSGPEWTAEEARDHMRVQYGAFRQ